MNVSRFARSLGFGLALSVAIPAVADALPFRVYDPSTHTFITYEPDRSEANRPLDPQFHAQVVSFATEEAAGTIIVDTMNKFLYYVLTDGMAIRYGVGVGREGLVRHGRSRCQAGMANLDAAGRDDRAPA